MEFKPLGDKILVKPDPVKEKSSGGIVLAENAKEKASRGIIIAIGNETEHNFETRVGQRVVFGMYSGTELISEDDEQLYLIMREDELFSLII